MDLSSIGTIWIDHSDWVVAALGILLLQTTAIAVLLGAKLRKLMSDYLVVKGDFTDQRVAAETALQSKALIQKVIDASPDWIFLKDAEHRFLLVNEPFARAFNQVPKDMIGRIDSDFLPEELCEGRPDLSRPGLHDYDRAVFRGENVHLLHEQISLPGMAPRVFDTHKTPLRDSSERIIGNLCFRRDITDRFNREKEQSLLERQLQQAQKMELIGHLTGGVAHDFNNILASILGYAELIQMSLDGGNHARLSRYSDEILRAGIRGKELVQQLLTTCQNRESVVMAIFVQPIVKEVIRLLQSTFPTSISIHAQLADNLPQVLISSVQLHQILMNLGINSRDSIVERGTIDVCAKAEHIEASQLCESCHQEFAGHYLTLSVRDNGRGICPEDQVKIFDPFFTTKAVGSGSGLGLSVIHGIVHSAGGHIKLTTDVGSGTEFFVYLPAQKQETFQASSPVRLEMSPIKLNARILVVDDEPAIVEILRDILLAAGCHVTSTNSPLEALTLLQSEPSSFDALITDLTMPDMTGLELARAARAIQTDISIIMCTGYSTAISDSEAQDAGIYSVLTKPVPSKTILDTMAKCFNAKVDSETRDQIKQII